MAEPVRERVQRHREAARVKGLVRVEVELPRHLVVALRRPDETLAALLSRALTALQRQALPETGGAPSHPLPETIPPAEELLPDIPVPAAHTLPETPLYPGVLPETSLQAATTFPETFPETIEIAPKDAPLVALLRQTPLQPYAAIAAQLGISESQVRHKAAPWARPASCPNVRAAAPGPGRLPHDPHPWAKP